jgi:hypothetical protein
MKEIGVIIDLVLGDFENETVLAGARENALALCRSFELPY